MAAAFCPNCGCKIVVSKPRLEVLIECPDCEEELEIIRVKPFELDFVYGESENEDENQKDKRAYAPDAGDEWADYPGAAIGSAGFFKKEMKLI